MSAFRSMLRAAAALFVAEAGCASGLRVAETVGPVPEAAPPVGHLLVFTELHTLDPYVRDAYRLPYALYDGRGHRLRTVTSANDHPQPVVLSAGDYVVHATGHRGRADVHIRVAPGRTTEVFLDGTRPPGGVPDDALVRASNGAFIGWRAVR